MKTEFTEACVLTDWLQYQQNLGKIVKFSHIPHETPMVTMIGRTPEGKPIWKKNRKQAQRKKSEGVRAGVPDYIIVTRSESIFLELKTKKGKPSQEQIEWIMALRATGMIAEVCYGADEAILFINNFI